MTRKWWLGEPDCGEGKPDRPLKGPCHPPDGPCCPSKGPGYPPRPKSQKKDFCVKCPPKKPCNLPKCPTDSDGTWRKADQRRDLLKLNSQSQAAASHTKSRILVTSTWHIHDQGKYLRRFFSTGYGKRQTSEKSSHMGGPECHETKKESQLKVAQKPEVLYQKPPPLKLPKLPKCLIPQINLPQCPPPRELPKCPECPQATKPTETASKNSSTNKCDGESSEKPQKGLWERINEYTKRKMSISSSITENFLNKIVKIQRRYLSTSGTSSAAFSSKSDSPPPSPPWKTGKCKTIEEVCGEDIDKKMKALECKPMDCPKAPNTPCYPKKPRCAEVKKLGAKEKKPPVPDTTVEKIDYSKIQCEPRKLVKLGPCPPSPPPPPPPPPLIVKKKLEENDKKSIEISKLPPSPLPKPPAGPTSLCPCPPPLKLHPGVCPCYVGVKNLQPKPPTLGCPVKSKYRCPEVRVYYCPMTKPVCKKVQQQCTGSQKQKKP